MKGPPPANNLVTSVCVSDLPRVQVSTRVGLFFLLVLLRPTLDGLRVVGWPWWSRVLSSVR